MRMNKILPILLIAPLAACGTLQNGAYQTVRIETSPAVHATCMVSNERFSERVAIVPSHVSVPRAEGPLTVTCNTPDGRRGHTSVDAHRDVVGSVSPLATGAVVGGGLAGLGSASAARPALPAIPVQPQMSSTQFAVSGLAAGTVAGFTDSFTGGGHRYPDSIVVHLVQTTPVVRDAIARAVERPVAEAAAPAPHPRRRAAPRRAASGEVSK